MGIQQGGTIVSDYDNDRISAKKAIDLLRIQKHDFLNYMQIISGYLQLGKHDKAQHFVQKAFKDITSSGTIMGLADPALGMNLLLRVHNAYREHGINIALSTTTDLRLVVGSDFNAFLDKVISAIEEVYAMDTSQSQIQIDLSENDKDYKVDISLQSIESDFVSRLMEKVREAAGNLGSSTSIKGIPEAERGRLQVVFQKTPGVV